MISVCIDVVLPQPSCYALGITKVDAVSRDMGLWGLDAPEEVGGMNLPMAITSAVMKDMLEGPDLVAAVLPEAQAALQEFKVVQTEEEEDDDI